MTTALRKLASTRLTVFGMVLLGIGAALNYDNPAHTPVWVLVVPLALLALNLCAAIITNPRINRRGGLLVFHTGLLAIVVLAAIGRLTHIEANVELVEGQGFMPEDMDVITRGAFHRGGYDDLRFVQGPFTIDYTEGMTRGPTRNEVAIPDGAGGWEKRVIGDDTPLVIDGYRFYTTFNKGFAAVLTWMPDGGTPHTGAIHMPSYPLFEHRQANRWQPEGGDEIRFWLQLETGMDPAADWRLEPATASGLLVMRAGERRIELEPGASVRLDGGTLRFERMSGWMGYKLYYDPTLQWLFIISFITVFGLAAHFWRKFGAVQVYASAQETAWRKGVADLSGGKPL